MTSFTRLDVVFLDCDKLYWGKLGDKGQMCDVTCVHVSVL